MKTKPKKCWAVISPDGSVCEIGGGSYVAIIRSVRALGNVWDTLEGQGYRCVRVELRAEEIA